MIGSIQKSYIRIFLLLVIFTCQLSAQNYNVTVQQWGVEDGLLHREVNAIYQDTRGFIWLGTPYGLNRFDGEHFDWWTPVKDSFNIQNIFNIKEDSYHHLWLTSSKLTTFKIDLFDPLTHSVAAFEEIFQEQMDFKMVDLSPGLIELSSGSMALLDTVTNRLIIADQKQGLSYIPLQNINNPRLICANSNGLIWIIHDRYYISSYDLKGNVQQSFHFPFGFAIGDLDEPSLDAKILITECTQEGFTKYKLLNTVTSTVIPLERENYNLKSTFIEAIDLYVSNTVSNPLKGWNLINFKYIADDQGKVLLDLNPYLSSNEEFFRSNLIDHKGRIWL
ncbi:MAG: two-component regulator propeller domain-containing protein, partial [Bacteroidota bacterium]